ncbi:uncharacterized protein AKAME5_002197300 [Lates japonicus]|uniref:Uncharacterized protein n=1 Tax=Lates japonicus TaxID=270547 RepID=A0AAD3NFB5_LATJO|nr:uncharacterized protein AKAME5_002197300 [Lates japonicus]
MRRRRHEGQRSARGYLESPKRPGHPERHPAWVLGLINARIPGGQRALACISSRIATVIQVTINQVAPPQVRGRHGGRRGRPPASVLSVSAEASPGGRPEGGSRRRAEASFSLGGGVGYAGITRDTAPGSVVGRLRQTGRLGLATDRSNPGEVRGAGGPPGAWGAPLLAATQRTHRGHGGRPASRRNRPPEHRQRGRPAGALRWRATDANRSGREPQFGGDNRATGGRSELHSGRATIPGHARGSALEACVSENWVSEIVRKLFCKPGVREGAQEKGDYHFFPSERCLWRDTGGSGTILEGRRKLPLPLCSHLVSERAQGEGRFPLLPFRAMIVCPSPLLTLWSLESGGTHRAQSLPPASWSLPPPDPTLGLSTGTGPVAPPGPSRELLPQTQPRGPSTGNWSPGRSPGPLPELPAPRPNPGAPARATGPRAAPRGPSRSSRPPDPTPGPQHGQLDCSQLPDQACAPGLGQTPPGRAQAAPPPPGASLNPRPDLRPPISHPPGTQRTSRTCVPTLKHPFPATHLMPHHPDSRAPGTLKKTSCPWYSKKDFAPLVLSERFRAPGTLRKVSCPWYSQEGFVPLVLPGRFRAPGTLRKVPCPWYSQKGSVPLSESGALVPLGAGEVVAPVGGGPPTKAVKG